MATSPPGTLPTYKLLTVNNLPERAKVVVSRLSQELSARYRIEYVGNAENIESVASAILSHNPDILFIASVWTPQESAQIKQIAEETSPGLKVLIIPSGLTNEKGIEGVVEYLVERVPSLFLGT